MTGEPCVQAPARCEWSPRGGDHGPGALGAGPWSAGPAGPDISRSGDYPQEWVGEKGRGQLCWHICPCDIPAVQDRSCQSQLTLEIC